MFLAFIGTLWQILGSILTHVQQRLSTVIIQKQIQESESNIPTEHKFMLTI